MGDKFCNRCKYSELVINRYPFFREERNLICIHPDAGSVDLVSGEREDNTCSFVRDYKACGREGSWFIDSGEVKVLNSTHLRVLK